MSFWEKLGKIDRRIIYMVLAVAVIVPLILTVKLPSKVRAMPRTKSIFDHIENIDPNGERKAILLSVDFDPQTEPELKPQFEAIIRHAFARNIPLLVMALPIQGTDIGLEVLTRLAEEHNKEYGKDYVLLGWKPSPVAVILGMGNFIDQVFPADYFGTPLAELPVMKGIRNYDNVGLVMDFTGSSYYGWWIVYAYTPYGVPVATGVTSVSVADIYPYLGSKQFVGMLAGMKAGAEYERLVKDRYYPNVVVKCLGKDSYNVTIEKQSYDADSNDIVSLARRFDLNLDELYNTLDSQGKFEKTLVLLKFPDTTTYSRDLVIKQKHKDTTVTLEGQELALNRDEMLAIADLYDVSNVVLDTILKIELKQLLRVILGDDRLEIEPGQKKPEAIKAKVDTLINTELRDILTGLFQPPPPEILAAELPAEVRLRQELKEALKDKISINFPYTEITQATAEEILRTELTEILEEKQPTELKEKIQRSIFLRGTQAMPALSASLLVIILFVILGNISFFATRRKK